MRQDVKARDLSTLAAKAVDGYQKLPSWVLLPQIFLAAGWGRAAVAHALSGDWWRGQEVLDFVATETEHRVGAYGYVLRWIVEPLPTTTAVVVVTGQLLVAVMLALNYRVGVALGIGAFLNIQFILAGAVNPSIFYLVATLGIVVWRLETAASPATIRRLARVTPYAAVAVAVALTPSVRSLDPETAKEDPALVLIFLAALTTAALWWIDHRIALADDALAALITDEEPGQQPIDRPTSLVWPVLSMVASVVILVGGVAVIGGEDGARHGAGAGTIMSEVADERAGPVASVPLGTFDAPYPFGRSVLLSYDDQAIGAERAWRIQLLEAAADRTGDFDVESPPSGERLVAARIRITYERGVSPGPVAQLRFDTVGPGGSVFRSTTQDCRSPIGKLAGRAGLEVSDAIEGLLCWWVPAAAVDSLVLAVEAEPADGVVYLALD